MFEFECLHILEKKRKEYIYRRRKKIIGKFETLNACAGKMTLTFMNVVDGRPCLAIPQFQEI
jgi:hypothetical protein